MEIYLMHYEWSDHCIFYENNSLKRKNIDNEWGSYENLDDNIIKIKWEKWDEFDYFKKFNGYYFLNSFYENYIIDEDIQEINFSHDEWNGYCILLKKKNIIFKKNKLEEIGNYEIDKDFIKITWTKWGTEYFIKNNNEYQTSTYFKENNNETKLNNNKLDINIKNNAELHDFSETDDNIFKKIDNCFYSKKYLKNNNLKGNEQDYSLINNLNIFGVNSNNLFCNMNIFNENYINKLNFNRLREHYTFDIEFLNNKFFKLNLDFKIEKKSKNRILTLAEWGYPPFGGGENWLLNMNKIFYNNKYENYFICFSDGYTRQNFNGIKLIDLEYVKIIQMKKNTADLVKLILNINPDFINHQGINRLYFLKIANLLNIPFLTGFCFWNDIIKQVYQNINILENNNLERDDNFNLILENSYCYACSEFVNDVIFKYFNKRIDVIETISLKEDILITKNNKKDRKYVTLINCHHNKGGFLLNHLLKYLNINIPLLLIYTEKDDLINLENIQNNINERNKRNNINIFYTEKQNIKDIYEVTRIMLIPSLCDETFCRVGYESRMNNIPIIARSNGNLKYLLKDYATFLDDNFDNWRTKIESMYINSNLSKLFKNNLNIENYQKNVEDLLLKKINFNNKSKYQLNNDHIGLIVPWADQGLGIQARSYYSSLKEIGFEPYIFSFMPYHGNESNNYLQNDVSEWKYDNVYYSRNIRENIQIEEIIDFVYFNKIKKIIIIEATFENIFNIASLLKMLSIEIYLIVNIECIRITELNYHYIFDKILCNNFNSYYILNNLIKNNKIEYLNFHLENKNINIYKKKYTKKNNNLIFVCSGGLNSISRKNIDKIIHLFYNLIVKNKISNVELRVLIQGIEVPTLINEYKNENIKFIIENASYEKNLKNISECDIFIHLGGQEGLGLGFYESLYLGVPVLTIDWTPNNEIVKDNINGWLIKCNYDNVYENQECLIYRGMVIEELLEEKILNIYNNIENTINIINKTISNKESFYKKNKMKFLNNLKYNLSPTPNLN